MTNPSRTGTLYIEIAMRHLRFVSTIVVACLLIATVVVPAAVFAARGNQQPPKIQNLWFTWQLTDENVAELAKWDVVVLDMDQQTRFPERMRRLRQLNPGIKILAYVDSCNIATARFVEESWFPGYKLAHALPEMWYMHRGSSRASIWPWAWMMNVTDKSPADAQGRRWADYLPEFIEKEIWSTGLWDGVFLDNALDNATWFAGKGLDITGDGIAETDAVVDAAWKAGWQRMAKNLRTRLGSGALIMGNGSVAHASVVNGILFENFPRYGWTSGVKNYQDAIRINNAPTMTAFNSNPNNVSDSRNWKLVRYTLGSALLGDGYYSFDYGDKDHGQTWWYDEYDATLGKAISGPERLLPTAGTDIREGVWWRDYERGAVVVNSTNQTANVTLPGVFERLRGTQDSVANSGRLETALSLPAQDGLLLYRRTEAQTLTPGSAFRNGDFVRVYRADGSQARAGFFTQRTGAAGGASVLLQDVDRDGKIDVLVGARGEIKLTLGNGKARVLRPFGTAYRGSITLAAGNTDRDAPWEVVAGNDKADVRVMELDGTLRATWRPYAAFRGTISVAIGDLNGDGLNEVVTGAGPGGGPHVRVFKTDGALWGGSWFAYDSRERGGVFVSVGDLDGDGKAEVIAGAGVGTVPRIRLFNERGERQREFSLSAEPGSIGVRTSVSDVDGDGALEILASGIRAAP